jgi:hypothetical protein
MVLVTASKISPENTPPALPKLPQKPLDSNKFDGSKPGGGGK